MMMLNVLVVVTHNTGSWSLFWFNTLTIAYIRIYACVRLRATYMRMVRLLLARDRGACNKSDSQSVQRLSLCSFGFCVQLF